MVARVASEQLRVTEGQDVGQTLGVDADILFGRGSTDELGRLSPTDCARAVELRRDAVVALEEHDWHGNLRELETVLERALLLYRDGNTLDGKAVRAAR